jgi:RND family efflux transporter MFP subunit
MRTPICLAAAALITTGAQAAPDGFDCLIEPNQVVEMRTSVDGIIASIGVQRGDAVRRGQVLAELESTAEKVAVESARFRAQMEGQVASARNRVDYATKKVARLTELQQQNYASAQARDEADAERRLAESELQAAIENRDLAKIEYRRAQEQLALRSLVSPLNGVVVDRMLNPGDLAESGSGRKGILKVAQIDPLRVDIVMPAALFGRVRTGMKATVVPIGVGAGPQAAVVRLVDRVIDAASATFIVRLDLPNPQHQLPGGVRCRATIENIKAPEPPLARAQ